MTKKATEENICIDWLRCTFVYDVTIQDLVKEETGELIEEKRIIDNSIIQDLAKILGFQDASEATKLDYGRDGYSETLVFGEMMKIYLNGPKNSLGVNTHMLDLSGQACREFEIKSSYTWRELIAYLNKRDVNFKRIDIAFDLFSNKYFTIDKLISKIKNFEFSSNLRDRQIVDEASRLKRKGFGCYVGSTSSKVRINVYDKNLERENKNIQTFVDVWNRIEIRFQQDKAASFIKGYLVEKDLGFVKYSKGCLNGYLELKTRGKDSVVSRWNTWTPWKRFINTHTIKLDNQGTLEQSITRKKNWIQKQVIKTLFMIKFSMNLSNENNLETFLNDNYQDIREKFDKRDIGTINTYLQAQGLEPIELTDLYKYIDKIKSEMELPF